MTQTMNLGFSRVGARRELKRALEAYWNHEADRATLLQAAAALRRAHWTLQRDAGVQRIPSNDFSLYDHVLDAATVIGATPPRYTCLADDPLDQYFAMARGHQDSRIDVPAMEMTKWFDTNYHYIVPEFSADMDFRLASTKPVDEYLEAKALGFETRPVLVGPVSLLLLGKVVAPDGRGSRSPLTFLDRILPAYGELLGRLADAGAEWVQLDEPMLVTDLADARPAYAQAYDALRAATPTLKLLLATYFGGLRENISLAATLPIDGLHIDIVRAPDELDAVVRAIPRDRVLSAGVIDGRNVWRSNLDQARALLDRIIDARGGDGLWVGPSCSLLHVPVTLASEQHVDPMIKGWLAFGAEKLGEITALASSLDKPPGSVSATTTAFAESRRAVADRATSPRVHDEAVRLRLAEIGTGMRTRQSPYGVRHTAQGVLDLPLLPTTTIGSFPQTRDVRAARAEFRAGRRSAEDYDDFLRAEIHRTVQAQEAIGLDVLVHGEFERNDMVEYFGEQLAGFAFTDQGWVQSYGSRCVKPPIIYGDVSRPKPITVHWARYAQSLTRHPVKGMLTGPVTILQWSFVRDDQSRRVTCDQIALAIRDEVADLEAAGIRVIQIDEPALREGLPLRRSDWAEYLEWAVGAFRLASSGVRDETQIHTHMCYSEFTDILEGIARMDADVISMEASRSNLELLDAFARFRYPNAIGPGVYDIHSPRVPSDAEMLASLRRATSVLEPSQVWVNPDCGLKTRQWTEVIPALEGMVRTARRLRQELTSSGTQSQVSAADD